MTHLFFKLLGVLVLAWVYGAARAGEVQVRSGLTMRLVRRDDEPRYFWVCIAIYTALGVALLTVF